MRETNGRDELGDAPKVHNPDNTDRACCLCGLPYDRIGNNPAPLANSGRCCDACNETVIRARIDPVGTMDEIERATDAILRMPHDDLHAIGIAAICASRGPVLWAQRQRERAQLVATTKHESRD